MAMAQVIKGEKREVKTKGYLKDIKRQGYIPGVIYGKGEQAIPIALGDRPLMKTFNTYGSRGIFSLEIEGESKPYMTIVRELQKHPLSGNIIHVDFMMIDMTEKLTSFVSIFVTGEEEVIKKDGIVQLGAKEVEVECLPQDLPSSFTCDVSDLEIGDKIVIGQLEVPDGVEILGDADSVVVTILAPSLEDLDEEEEETEETEETETEEPEEE